MVSHVLNKVIFYYELFCINKQKMNKVEFIELYESEFSSCFDLLIVHINLMDSKLYINLKFALLLSIFLLINCLFEY